MASTSEPPRLRHRIREIELSPTMSTRDVVVKVLVNGTTTYKLRSIEAGQPLCWKNQLLICDVALDTDISIHVIEKRRLHQDRVGMLKYRIADVANKEEMSLESDNRAFTATLRFFGNEVAKNWYTRALAKVQATQGGMSPTIGKTDRAFQALINFGDVIGKFDPTGSANIVVGLCSEAWEHLEQERRQNIALNELVEGLAAIVPSIHSAEELANANLGRIITDMLYLIEDVSVFIFGYKSDGSLAQSMYSPFNSSIQEKADAFIARFQKLKDGFDRGIHLQTLKIQQLEKLKELNPVGHASYDPDRACMPNTRMHVIDAIVDWAQNDNEATHIYWVHGFAGLGKSSIAASVCQRLEDQGILAASFFCKRDDPDLRDARRVLNTIIYGLATRYEPYGLKVAKAIQDDAQLCTSHIQRRYTGLLHKPLQNLGKTGPNSTYVVVVDALDECEGRDSRAPLLACLRSMGQLVPWLKLVITSRPDEDIMTTFGRGGDQVMSRDLFEDGASQDIYAFVRKQMADIATAKRRDAWSEDTIWQLVERAGGLFIWAATACRFIAEGFSVEDRLQEILGTTSLAVESHPLAMLDRLYETAIRHSLNSDREDNRQMVRRCLGVIVCTSKRTPLSVSSLEALLSDEVEPGVFGSVVGALGSVLHEDGTVGGAVRVYHPSFEDYLVTRSDQFRVGLAELDVMVARCCLNTMLRELRFNICNLETSHVPNRDVLDLEDRILNTIGGHLDYSCLYWSSHLDGGHTELVHLLREFLFGCALLYWIEVLSLLNRLDVGLSSLLAVSSFPSEALADCSSCADDAYRFILAFYDPISESAPHLYLSALAFAPAESEIAQRMYTHFPNKVSITSGGDEHWSACLRTIPIPSPVSVLEVTFDGSRIVSGHRDGTVQVWDVDTGTAVLEPLQDHLGRVSALAISRDNRLIASGSKVTTARVWNIETGAEILALGDHLNTADTDWISSIAFSPSGHRIASGSDRGKVMVWNAETGTLVFETSVDTESIRSVVFSHRCLYVLSDFLRFFPYIWSGEMDDLVLRPTQGPQHLLDRFAGVAISQSRCLVASSVDDKIHVWDCSVDAEVCEPIDTRSGSVHPLGFSPDGYYLLLRFWENIVQIWDTRTGMLAGNPFYCHSGVEFVAFSPRNHRIISASSDRTIRIWSSDPRSTYHKPRRGVSGFCSVEWSPNGDRVVSGHPVPADAIFRLWDAHTGALILAPLLGQYKSADSVAFSPDGRHIASGLENGKVIVCDADSGAIVHTLEGPTNVVLSVGFWVGGSIVYSCSRKSLRAWNLRTGTVVRDVTIGSSGVHCTALSPNGRLLALSSGDQVEVKDIETNTPLSTLRGHSEAVLCLAFFPDSRRIASGSEDNSVRLWDVETGTALIEPLRGHFKVVNSVSFSHDGRFVASGSDDCTIRIWDAVTGALVYQPLLGHSGPVLSAAFSFDGCRILSRGASFLGESRIRIWDLDTLPRATEPSSPPTSTDAEIHSSDPFLRSEAVAASRLARHTSSGGWVITENKEHLLWLPVEYRRVDDSSLCIMPNATRIRVVIDMRRFVHGTSWASVAGPAVDIP